MTGYLPYYIENENLPENRKNIWGSKDQKVSVPEIRKTVTEASSEHINII
jgi:hypothetical protein